MRKRCRLVRASVGTHRIVILKRALDGGHGICLPATTPVTPRLIKTFARQHAQVTLRESHRSLQLDVGTMRTPRLHKV